MRSDILTLLVAIMATVVGIFHVANTQEKRQLWSQYEKTLQEKNSLNAEWNKLKLEESMLITSVLLDSNIREALGMVIPDHNAVVYILEQKQKALVSTKMASAHNEYIQ